MNNSGNTNNVVKPLRALSDEEFDGLLNECHERVTVQQKVVTHFEIGPYHQVRRGYHLESLREIRILEHHLTQLAMQHEMTYFWEWLDLDKRHVFFIDIKEVNDDNVSKLMNPFLRWLHKQLTSKWLQGRYDSVESTTPNADAIAINYAPDVLYELTELQTNTRRIIIPWLVLPHNECLALFDLILVSSMDKFAALTKKFDRTAMDNGRIKMPYCDEIDPMHKPLDRPFVIKTTCSSSSMNDACPRIVASTEEIVKPTPPKSKSDKEKPVQDANEKYSTASPTKEKDVDHSNHASAMDTTESTASTASPMSATVSESTKSIAGHKDGAQEYRTEHYRRHQQYQQRYLHHSKLSIGFPNAERSLTSEQIQTYSWIPKGPLKDLIAGLTYRKRPSYPRKDPWMIQRDPYAWDFSVADTFDWHSLKHTVDILHKGCDSTTKRQLIVDYMNRFFAIITMEGQVEIIVKQWDTTKDCAYFVRRSMQDFLMAMENKTFWLKQPIIMDGIDVSSTLANTRSNGRNTAPRGRNARSRMINNHTEGSELAQGDIYKMFHPMQKRTGAEHQRIEQELVNQAGDNAGPLVGIKGKGESIGKIWRYSLNRKEFSKQVFNPFPDDHKFGSRHDELNTWTGLRYSYAECKKAYNNPDYARRALLILHHIKYVICKGDEINYMWFLAWLASTIQKPWHKMHTMVVIYGYPGSGKGIFISPFIELFGQHGMPCHDMTDVLGKFNPQTRDKCMIWFDEAMSPGSKKEENAFKLFITEKKHRVEQKFKDATQVDNFCNIIASTNDLKSVPAGNNSRRYFCLDMDNRYSTNREAGRLYFDKLQHAIENDDFAGMKAWQAIMMEIDISTFDRAQNPPQTALLRIQQHEQVDSVTRWLYDCCERGFHCKVGGLQDNNHLMMFTFKDGRVANNDDGVLDSEWIREISKKDLYDNYCESSSKHAVSQTTFFMRLKELLPSIIDKTVSMINGKQIYSSIEHKIRVWENGQRVRRNLVYIILPSLDDARLEFKHSTGFGFNAAATTTSQVLKRKTLSTVGEITTVDTNIANTITSNTTLDTQVQVNLDMPSNASTSTNTTIGNDVSTSGSTSTTSSQTNTIENDKTAQATTSQTLADEPNNMHMHHNPYDYFDEQTWSNLILLLQQVDPIQVQHENNGLPSTSNNLHTITDGMYLQTPKDTYANTRI